MKEKKELMKLLNFLKITLQKGITFTKKQLPFLAQELITLEIIKSIIIVCAGVIYTIILFIGISSLIKNFNCIVNWMLEIGSLGNGCGGFLLAIFGFLSIIGFIMGTIGMYELFYKSIEKLIMIKFAPRFFLIKRIKELIKELKEE